jgi:osmotically inducible protein OsmC
MALSHGLAEAGNAPEKLDVTATSTFVPGTGITQMKLDVTGTVPGIDEAAFVTAAEGARDNCPVSGALKGNVEILLDARLAG